MKPTIPQKNRRPSPLALAFELALLAAIILMVVSGARPAAAQELPSTNAPNTTVKSYPLAHPFVPCESGEYCHVPYGVHTFDASRGESHGPWERDCHHRVREPKDQPGLETEEKRTL